MLLSGWYAFLCPQPPNPTDWTCCHLEICCLYIVVFIKPKQTASSWLLTIYAELCHSVWNPGMCTPGPDFFRVVCAVTVRCMSHTKYKTMQKHLTQPGWLKSCFNPHGCQGRLQRGQDPRWLFSYVIVPLLSRTALFAAHNTLYVQRYSLYIGWACIKHVETGGVRSGIVITMGPVLMRAVIHIYLFKSSSEKTHIEGSVINTQWLAITIYHFRQLLVA